MNKVLSKIFPLSGHGVSQTHFAFIMYLQIDKLVRTGGNILAPIAIGPKRLIGTAVDYAYYMFYQVIYTSSIVHLVKR